MRDITRDIEQFTKGYQQKCPSFKAGACASKAGCGCALRAEIYAYIYGVIPKEFHNLEYKDFKGNVPGIGQVVPPKVVGEAKKRIALYCWGKHPDGTDYSSPEMLKHSRIDERRANGQNLVIHGDDTAKGSKKSGETVVVRRKIGRSFLAAIVMKEIIKRRAFAGHAADTYEWVQFQTLKARVLAKDADSTFEYQTCDWLVVDNVNKDDKGSDNMKTYTNNMLDTVFMERIENQLPTILVCQFDVEEVPNLEDYFGIGISQIIRDSDKNTLKVSLSNRIK